MRGATQRLQRCPARAHAHEGRASRGRAAARVLCRACAGRASSTEPQHQAPQATSLLHTPHSVPPAPPSRPHGACTTKQASACTRTPMHAHPHTCAYAHLRAHTHTCVPTRTHYTQVPTHTSHTYTPTCTNTLIHTCTHSHSHIRSHAHKHTYAHTHTQPCLPPRPLRPSPHPQPPFPSLPLTRAPPARPPLRSCRRLQLSRCAGMPVRGPPLAACCGCSSPTAG